MHANTESIGCMYILAWFGTALLYFSQNAFMWFSNDRYTCMITWFKEKLPLYVIILGKTLVFAHGTSDNKTYCSVHNYMYVHNVHTYCN